jgi:hypothetical protein
MRSWWCSRSTSGHFRPRASPSLSPSPRVTVTSPCSRWPWKAPRTAWASADVMGGTLRPSTFGGSTSVQTFTGMSRHLTAWPSARRSTAWMYSTRRADRPVACL